MASSKAMKGCGGQVLYLDFDGVLHHENCYWRQGFGAYLVAPPEYRLFQHADLLAELLAPYPAVEIVLSTSWVRRLRYSHAAKRLPPSLKSRVIGATFHTWMDEDEFTNLPRGVQVWNDVVRRKPETWLALDDDYFGWPTWCLDNYVQTHETEGISDPTVTAMLILKLQRFTTERPVIPPRE